MRVFSRYKTNLITAMTVLTCLISLTSRLESQTTLEPSEMDSSPNDLTLTQDEQWLFTANHSSGTVSMIHLPSATVTSEIVIGPRLSSIVLTPDESELLLTSSYLGNLTIVSRNRQSLDIKKHIHLGFEPRGVAVSPDGKWAYVALSTAHTIAVVDLTSLEVVEQIPVKRWPRFLTLTSDGKQLAVGCSGDQGIAVVDTESRSMVFFNRFRAINLGQMVVSHDGKHAYAPWMIYRRSAITPANIRQGWVLASRIARIRLDEKARREAISLDKPGEAVSDPHGLAISPDNQWLVCTASGTHELLVFRHPDLPFQDYGGPGDHINRELVNDPDRFFRIPVGGRPMAVRFSQDNDHVYVANYLLNSVQVVSLHSQKIVRVYPLGPEQPTSLARRGEAIFYDGKYSLDQWYSCHSCHYEGHTNAVAMDTHNDGTRGTYKTVLSLRNVTDTGPWTWHGWQQDIRAAMKKSLTDTMLGPMPAPEDINALIAFLQTLRSPPNPFRSPDGSLPLAAQRGKTIFHSAKAGCARCHSGKYFTDGKIHEVGLAAEEDGYVGYNPPSLVGVYDRMRYLHDGRAKTLEHVLTDSHSPLEVSGNEPLSNQELSDLVHYLKSL